MSSCAYYNGMYYANHYAKQAQHSEENGRHGAALDQWRLAAMHAESVATRHPRSRWADDAQLVRGKALVYLESYNDAVVALDVATRLSPPGEQRREAWLYLGRANLATRRFPQALDALDSAAASRDGRRRAEALLYRGRTRMMMGDARLALEDFRASTANEARVERVRASLILGDSVFVSAFADSLLGLPFQESWWLPLLAGMGDAGMAAHASRLVDRLVPRRDVEPGARARLLLADGDRALALGRRDAASQRFQAAVLAVPDSSEAREAALRLARIDLYNADDLGDESPVREALERIAAQGGSSRVEAVELVRLFGRADSLAAATTAADAMWFLRAELLRDSLEAPRLAAAAFAEMDRRFPDSPWTPKGLLAAITMAHPAADSLRGLLRARYAGSPYTLVALGTGDDPERFAALEDSLRVVLSAVSGTPEAAPQPARAPNADDFEPNPRARPAPAQPRPTQPRRTIDP